MKFSLRAGGGGGAAAGPAKAEPADGGAAASIATFMAVVGRVEAVVEAETEAFSRNLKLDMVALNQRKRQGLLELSRVLRNLPGLGPNAVARERLAGLAGKLETNRTVLDRQLRALREVADIVSRSLKEAESDGTYSRLAGTRAASQP
ncbi:MAG TPA: hypothetical protein VH414_07655 [Lichenihabitans sp.]|jgi:hypothetical protein|nr:hypothetical protein [Lichenihabitans sp.]